MLKCTHVFSIHALRFFVIKSPEAIVKLKYLIQHENEFESSRFKGMLCLPFQ